MIKSFDVLNRAIKLRQNYLLEASAGTGKTFSIQHLVVRLLIESKGEGTPLTIDKILVVTFTRAATRDLKIRIRRNIEDALKILKERYKEESPIPDYLKACLEKGQQEVDQAVKCLQQALFLFDQAQICTIHSYCARMLRQFSLESDTSLAIPIEDKPLPRTEVLAVIRDFFRTEIQEGKFSVYQLGQYLKKDPEQAKLLKIIQSGYELVSLPTFEQLTCQFQEIMSELKVSHSLMADKMVEDFQKQAIAYKNYSRATKVETLDKINRFSKLVEKEQWTGQDLDILIEDSVVWTKALDPRLIKKEPIDLNALHYPHLTNQLSEKLSPLIEKAGDFSLILASMAKLCRQHLIRYQQEEEKFSPDDILRKMRAAIEQPLFIKKARGQYLAVIVDEFQDTDPLQWAIFSRLYLPLDSSWKGNLYLVGDPKQSIYSFRQADIYTYLAAAEAIGEKNCFTLSVNHRSQAPLVEALNLLFSQEYLPSFIPLPKQACDLSYHPVLAAKERQFFDEERGTVHFMIADCKSLKKPSLQLLEEKVYFPFIASEIFRLIGKQKISFCRFAVLVRDRNQALRLAEYLKQHGIPFLNQRGTSLATSQALEALTKLVTALLHPRDRGKILAAFGSPLWGWTYDELIDPERMEFILSNVQRLSKSLKEKVFPLFFQDLLQTKSKPEGATVMESLLARNEGADFYRDLQQLADCISDHQYIEWNAPEGIIPFLDQIQQWEQNDDERVKRFEDPEKDGVKILTLHSSKGLEFDIVFALGLINRHEMQDDLIPCELQGQMMLAPIREENAAYLPFCEECDSEKMRQLYVACTRAKHQLYIPAILDYPSENLKWGEASPMDLFLARLCQPQASYQILYERIRQQTGTAFINFLDKAASSHSITYSIHQNFTRSLKNELHTADVPCLQAPSCLSISYQQIWMSSFTSLNHHREQKVDLKDLPTLIYPSDFNSAVKDVHSLPANSETGLLIHRLLEKLSFCSFEKMTTPEEAISLIRPCLRQTPFMDWEYPIAQLLYNSLKATLPAFPTTFSLSNLKTGNFYQEMPFLFPYAKEEKCGKVALSEGLIKGVMDLLFYHEGKYCLVDWKTNWLGPDQRSYATARLEEAMHEHGYFLQASIYAEAIERYLKLVDKRPFNACFGGVYYLFLRGMREGKSDGIYHFFPEIDGYGNFIKHHA